VSALSANHSERPTAAEAASQQRRQQASSGRPADRLTPRSLGALSAFPAWPPAGPAPDAAHASPPLQQGGGQGAIRQREGARAAPGQVGAQGAGADRWRRRSGAGAVAAPRSPVSVTTVSRLIAARRCTHHLYMAGWSSILPREKLRCTSSQTAGSLHTFRQRRHTSGRLRRCLAGTAASTAASWASSRFANCAARFGGARLEGMSGVLWCSLDLCAQLSGYLRPAPQLDDCSLQLGALKRRDPPFTGVRRTCVYCSAGEDAPKTFSSTQARLCNTPAHLWQWCPGAWARQIAMTDNLELPPSLQAVLDGLHR
jgi:hypothetical protein